MAEQLSSEPLRKAQIDRGAPPQTRREASLQNADTLPDLNQRLYPVQKLAAVVGALGEEGVLALEVLKGSGLTPADLQSTSTRISYSQTIIVFTNALRLSKDPAIALRAGRRMHVTSYGMHGYALLSCSTLAAVAEFVNKYVMAIGPTFTVRFSSDADWARYEFLPIISQDPLSDLYRFGLEFALGSFYTRGADIIQKPPEFTHLRIVYPAPAHASAYHDLFRCPIFFNSAVNEVQYPALYQTAPIAYADALTHELSRQACEDILREADKFGALALQVRQALLRIPNRFPSAETVAAELSMSPRRLQRGLEAEGASYRKLRDEVRMGLAIAYLRKTQITIADIATRLGYSDEANFRHAFRRWTGKNTSDFRRN
jgi:AraC-like DNA-binding protein